jgi:hypothetical protein
MSLLVQKAGTRAAPRMAQTGPTPHVQVSDRCCSPLTARLLTTTRPPSLSRTQAPDPRRPITLNQMEGGSWTPPMPPFPNPMRWHSQLRRCAALNNARSPMRLPRSWREWGMGTKTRTRVRRRVCCCTSGMVCCLGWPLRRALVADVQSHRAVDHRPLAARPSSITPEASHSVSTSPASSVSPQTPPDAHEDLAQRLSRRSRAPWGVRSFLTATALATNRDPYLCLRGLLHQPLLLRYKIPINVTLHTVGKN